VQGGSRKERGETDSPMMSSRERGGKRGERTPGKRARRVEEDPNRRERETGAEERGT